jgi:hypothetical protein
MNVRMKADYIEVFERGDYRPLFFGFVYDLDRLLATMLIEHGMADPLEVESKKTDNKKKEGKNVPLNKQRASKFDQPRVSHTTSIDGGKRGRVKKRAKN